MISRPWTSQQVDSLAALIVKGVSYGKAAVALGVSRNAAIGVANRRRAAGDARFATKAAPAAAEKPAKVRARPAPRLVVSRGIGDPPGLPLFSPRAAYLAFAPVTERKPLWETGDRECRYIGDDGLCCAGQTDRDVPYCAYHARLTYRRRA